MTATKKGRGMSGKIRWVSKQKGVSPYQEWQSSAMEEAVRSWGSCCQLLGKWEEAPLSRNGRGDPSLHGGQENFFFFLRRKHLVKRPEALRAFLWNKSCRGPSGKNACETGWHGRWYLIPATYVRLPSTFRYFVSFLQPGQLLRSPFYNEEPEA